MRRGGTQVRRGGVLEVPVVGYKLVETKASIKLTIGRNQGNWQ